MKQKLLMFLAVVLTGGMLVACGPGDETATDTTGGVVDEPIGGDPAATDTLGADPAAGGDAGTTVEMDLDDEFTPETEAAETEADADMTAETETTEVDTTEAAAEGDDEVAGGGAAAPAEGETVTIVFNQASDGVAVGDVQGTDNAEDVAAMDQSNPDLNLTVGQTYEFRYDGEGELVFFDSNDQPIFSTAGSDSEFAQNADVNAQVDEDSITFTLTEELGQELNRYAAGPDEQGGNINVNN